MKKALLILAVIFCGTIVMASNPHANKAGVINNLDSINNLDTMFFDLSKEIINGNNVLFPVYFKSDDTVTAVDFSMKFNLSHLTYDSIANLKVYLNPTANYQTSDSTLYLTSYSLTQIENNKSLISVYFDVTTGKINKPDLNSLLCYLNGNPCTCKVIDYTVGISEPNNDLVSTIFPNPVADVLVISMNKYLIDSSVSIYDETGKQVKVQHLNSGNSFSISCKEFSSGIYFYRINLRNEESVSGKFLKE